MDSLKEVLDTYTELTGVVATPQGAKMQCCYHVDSDPSLKIHEEKGIVKCFSCGTGRTLFSFLIEQGVPFDIAINYFFIKEGNGESSGLKEMKEYFLGKAIPKSMVDRGFTIETLQHFGVGYDTHEERITIPLRYKGKLYGIVYRKYPKIFWSSEDFNKQYFIYNYEATKDRYYVEGQTDTWNVWQNGTKNVSATLGSEITEEQLDLMAQHERIFLAFDNDRAGYKAMFRVQEGLQGRAELFVIPYPTADAGECSKELWLEAIDKPLTFTEFVIRLMNNNRELYDDLKGVGTQEQKKSYNIVNKKGKGYGEFI